MNLNEFCRWIFFVEFPMPKIWPIKCFPKMISMYVKCSRLYIRVVISYVIPIQWVNHHRFHRLGRYEYHHRNLVLHTKRPEKNTTKRTQINWDLFVFYFGMVDTNYLSMSMSINDRMTMSWRAKDFSDWIGRRIIPCCFHCCCLQAIRYKNI